MDKSLNFWKNDLKISKIGNPCCCDREQYIYDQPTTNDIKMENLPFYEPNKKVTNIFKTIKSDATTNISFSANFNKSDISFDNKDKKKYNDWKHEEDMMLIKLCNSHYHRKWKKISLIIGNNKTPRMCAYRLQKLLKTDESKNFRLKESRNMEKLLDDYERLRGSEVTSSILEIKKRKKKKRKIHYVYLI